MVSNAMLLNQLKQLDNPDGAVMLTQRTGTTLLAKYASASQGLKTGDDERYRRTFWEQRVIDSDWRPYQSTVERTWLHDGHSFAIDWRSDGHQMARRQGVDAWRKPGVAVSQMRNLPVSLYLGNIFDSNMSPIIPKDHAHLPAIWCFCSSQEFNRAVRAIDQSLKVTNATLVQVPFDLDHWQKVADEQYPDGLPEPHSDAPTQWLFRGDIPSSTDPLQVAVARLLGYRWPDQPDDQLDSLTDEDGIVTLAPLVGQEGLASRVRALLQAAYESEAPERPRGAPEVEEPRKWSEAVITRLLARAGSPGITLEEWVRDRFFDAHARLFHQRPFVWHIWDGRKDGFHAFISYHKLDRKNLERLTHVYLGEWIERQKAASETGDQTADARLIAAQQLQKKLELIRLGEKPYDIFIRWKTKAEQPIGWEPDLNDGVRMNIRPFVEAGVLRGKVNVNWNKDRGKDPKPNASGTVERHNDRHFTLAEKRASREETR